MLALSVRQTAEALNLSPRTIYRRIQMGEIKVLHHNGVIRIPIDQFKAGEQDDKKRNIWGYFNEH